MSKFLYNHHILIGVQPECRHKTGRMVVFMTAIDTRTNSATPDLKIPDRDDVVQAIVAEASAAGVTCTAFTANGFIKMLADAVRVLREYGQNNSHFVGDSDLESYHSVMDVIMLDHVIAPARGSAHDLLNLHLLNGESGELSLVHTRDLSYEQVEYCAIMLHIA